jgi:hypothetical protein
MTYYAPTYFGGLPLYGVSGLVDAEEAAEQIARVTRRTRGRARRWNWSEYYPQLEPDVPDDDDAAIALALLLAA